MTVSFVYLYISTKLKKPLTVKKGQVLDSEKFFQKCLSINVILSTKIYPCATNHFKWID